MAKHDEGGDTVDKLSSQVTTGAVRLEMHGTIAVLRIDNPPVNAGSHAVRSGLVDGLTQAQDLGATGAVLIGAGSCFVAGSDLKEFGHPLAWPQLPDVIRRIEDAPFPVLAALHGVALGGGLELALGCDYRIAAARTNLGLPEVSLGFVPGAGGTQRLPRLTGVVHAIDLICSAARIPAEKALTIGLIDALAQDDLLIDAIAFLAAEPRQKRPVKALNPPVDPPEAIAAAERLALKRGKGRPNVAAAIRLVKASANADVEAALLDEREVFQNLRLSDDAFALRHLFFAERRAASVDGLDVQGGKVASVGVIGGGTMGQGIARAFLTAGLPVTLIEQDTAALTTAITAIGESLDGQARKGRISTEQAKNQRDALIGALDYTALSACDLVIEAVFEDMAVKQEVFAKLEAVLHHSALIASNTSYLNIDEMAVSMARPDRVLGLHFFSPADIMPLLEVVRTGKTSDVVLATGLKLARTLGKQPVVARVAEGFIGNRIYNAYRNRAELLVLDGATPEQVDRAALAFGFAMGPFAVADMSGLDIAWATRKRKATTRDPRTRYVSIPDHLCEAGRLGRKTGAGWYDYSSGSAKPDATVTKVITDARNKAGLIPQSFDDETIQHQLLAAIINEAACVIDEGVAQRASDIDVVLTNGYGFPRWRGGPLYWAVTKNRNRLTADLDALAHALGPAHKAGPVMTVLEQIETSKKG